MACRRNKIQKKIARLMEKTIVYKLDAVDVL